MILWEFIFKLQHHKLELMLATEMKAIRANITNVSIMNKNISHAINHTNITTTFN